MPDLPALITGSQAAALVGVSKAYWYRVMANDVPHAYRSPWQLWRESDVRAYAEARRARIAEMAAAARGAGDGG